MIRVLPAEVSSRIAAGEVVESPASAVKELVENAVDAGASRVRVSVEEGGIRSIEVSDDGCGMSPEDARLSVCKYATSKIESLDDLFRLGTLGFRGEALFAIGTVSFLEIRTRRKGSESGTLVRVENGELRAVEETAAAPGTVVTVKNLFSGFPARRKFLRSPEAEFRRLRESLVSVLLGFDGVYFELEKDGRPSLSTAGAGGKRERIAAVFGAEAGEGLVPAAAERGKLSVSGFAGAPGTARRTAALQYLFVNGRRVFCRFFPPALRDAYAGLIERGVSPAAFLFLSVPPEDVDVNVHPAKREVRFRDERAVRDLVVDAVRAALGKSGDSILISGSEMSILSPDFPGLDRTDAIREALARYRARPQEWHEPSPAKPGGLPYMVPIGQVFGSYILAAGPEDLYLVDQHAAHERILYEKLAASAGTRAARQPLLVPLSVELLPDEADAVRESLELLGELGFAVEEFGSNGFLLREVPAAFGREGDAQMLKGIAQALSEGGRVSGEQARERLLQTLACHAAVKAGTPQAASEIVELLESLGSTRAPFVCPHGRPAVVRLTKAEIERMFHRR